MKRLRDLVVMTFVAASLIVTANAYAFDKGAGKAGQEHKKMCGELNLTDQQKKQLEENKSKNMELMKATFEKIKSSREALKAELMKPQLDMKKINDAQAQIKALQAQMTDNHLNSILEVRKILSREQFEKFISIMDKHKGWHRKEDKGACREKI